MVSYILILIFNIFYIIKIKLVKFKNNLFLINKINFKICYY